MAAGLLVVAPAGGGPATYVEDGVTGFLTRTSDAALLAASMSDALDAMELESAQTATTDARPHRSRETVLRDFTIQAMAGALSTVYADVSAAATDSRAGSVVAR
jgi:glycosyltransferase involved in cell wall biosynthesis